MGNNFSKTSSHHQDKPQNPVDVIQEHTLNTTWGTFRWKGCQENPGHKEFIPVKEFKLDHLPKGYRTDEIFRSIQLLADLTCRITARDISDRRPNNNALFNQAGRVRMGTGTVFAVIKDTEETEATKCVLCDGVHEKEGFYIIRVITACHVVFDCQEAMHTTIDLFYDDEINKEDIRTLDGCCVVNRDVSEDWCVIECRTRDSNLAERLQEKLHDFKNLILKRKPDISVPWVIVASHPHGLAKHITVGEWRKYDGTETTKKSVNVYKGNYMKFYEDCVEYNLIPSVQPLIVSNRATSECVGVECKVFLPDGTDMLCLIWQLDAPVLKTKETLINEAGLMGDSKDFYLELLLPDEERQVMDEDKELNYYMEDLTNAYSIWIRGRDPGATNCC